MEYESEAGILDKISFDSLHDLEGTITLRAGLTLYSKVVLDPWTLRDANIHILAIEGDRLKQQIVKLMRTAELEAELQRLRKFEVEHFSCPKQILDSYPW